MKGGRGLLGGLLVLALICAVPAVSAAQDSGSTDTTATTTTTQSDPAPAPAPPEPSAPTATTGGDYGGTSAPSGGSSGGGDSGSRSDAGSNSPGPSTQVRSESSADSSSGGGAHTSASSTTVTMGDYFFRPSTVTISVGDLVTWKNDGHEPHTATADDGSFDTGTVPAGGKASHMFTSPGTFTYVCTIHPNMKGTIRVAGSGGASGSGSGSGSASSSASGPTEAQAVNDPNAAGDKNTLPMSGMAVVPLTLAGLALLGSGLVVRRSARRLIGQQLSLF